MQGESILLLGSVPESWLELVRVGLLSAGSFCPAHRPSVMPIIKAVWNEDKPDHIRAINDLPTA